MLDQRFFANIDWVLCFLVLLICGMGLIALSSATVGTPGAGGLFNSAGFSYFSRNWSNYFSPIGSLSKLGAPGFCYASGSNWVAGSRAVLWNRWTWSTCTTLAESWAVFFPTF